MKKRKKSYVKLLISMMSMMLALTCFVTPAPIKAADVITGVGYTFNPDNGELTVNTDTGTFNWRDDTNIDKTKVMSINFGNLVTQIYGNAFSDCTSLESVVIPNTIEKMNDAAFAGCANLKRVEISDSVKTMGVYIFKDCTNLESVKLPANLESIAMRTFRGCSNLESIILPGNLKTINDEAFFNCIKLTSIVIPDKVETISKYSFMGCQSLSSITMSSGIKTIGEDAFMIISSNAVITMRGTTPPTIGSGAFYQPDTERNAKILIPFGSEDNYKADSSWAELGDSVTEPIPNTPTIKEVTYNQVELNELTYTDETVEYGISKTNDASTCTWQALPKFMGLDDDTTYYFFARIAEKSGTHVAGIATTGVSVKTNISYADKLSAAKTKAEESITSFVATNTVKDSDLVDAINAAISDTGVSAQWKTSPTIVKATTDTDGSIKGTITLTIDTETTDISVNKTIERIKEYSFNASTGELIVKSNDATTKWREDASIDKAKVTSINFSSTITEIGEEAFRNCANLKSVVIPDNVVTLKKESFEYCTNLESVKLSANLETIGSSAFFGSWGLKNIEIPDKVKLIDSNAFVNCVKLSSITISSSIQTIETSAFSGIASDAVITIRSTTPPKIGFQSFLTDTKIIVPIGCEANYKEKWNGISNTITEPRLDTPTTKEVTSNQIELNELTYTNETVEYGISKTNDASTCTWQASPKFVRLDDNTTYYFFARLAEKSGVHAAGIATTGVSVKTNISYTDKLNAAKVKAEESIASFIATNTVKDSDLVDVINAAISDIGVSAQWKTSPTIVKATTEINGSLKGTIVLTIYAETTDISVNKTIDKLDKEYSYTVTNGNGSLWLSNSTKGLTITVDGDYNKFTGIKIDGKRMNEGNYTAVKGSTVITLKTAYLKTLGAGKHTLTVLFGTKEVKAEFTIKKVTTEGKPTPDNKQDVSIKETTPKTGDTSNSMMWVIMLGLSALSLLVYRRKMMIKE